MYAPKHENPYLNLTPAALRRSIGMVGLLRQIAQGEADYHVFVDDGVKAAEFDALDVALYHTALSINSCCIGFGFERLD